MSDASRLAQIDLLKGAAILGVICLHGLSRPELHDSWAAFHVGQAVPVFMVLMAVNGTALLRRAPAGGLRNLYTRSYFAGRVERLVLPFAVVWVAALAVGLVRGDLDLGPRTLVGVIPVAAPGNYFVTIAFEFALLFPLLLWAFRRAPVVTVVALLAIDAAFELAAPELFSGRYPYDYDASILRYFGHIALGLWIAGVAGRTRWILALVPLSAVYLVLQHEDPSLFSWLRQDFTRTTNLLAAPYAAALVLAGLALLPRRVTARAPAALAALGRASWHVFLVQMLWFAVVEARGAEALPLHLAGSCAIGYAFHVAMERAPIVRRARARLWRVAA